MGLFHRKKDEVVFKKQKKPKKRPEAVEEEGVPQTQEEDAYADSFLPPEDEIVGSEKENKKEKKPKKKKSPKSETPFYRNRLVIGVTCIVSSCLLSFVLVPALSYVSSTEMATVAKVITPVAKGKRIEAAVVQTVQVPAMGAKGALPQGDLAVGKYAAVDLVAGDLLMDAKLTDVMPFPDDYLYQVPQGKQAISVTIPSFASGLSGKLVAGDIVSVYATLNQTSAGETDYHAIQPEELTYVKVLAVTDQLGQDKDRQTEEGSGLTDEEEQPATVTLLASPEQASAIAGLEVNAKLHLSLVSRGDPALAEQYLASQEEYLSNMGDLENALDLESLGMDMEDFEELLIGEESEAAGIE